MALVWQHGFGTELLFGTEAVGSVAFWSPMIVFAFIYGLSMDYEVFILARIREEYERTGSTDRPRRRRPPRRPHRPLPPGTGNRLLARPLNWWMPGPVRRLLQVPEPAVERA